MSVGIVPNIETGRAPAPGLPLVSPTYFDEEAVRALAEKLVRTAGNIEGQFCLATTPATGTGCQHYPVQNGPNAVADIVAKAREISVEGQNVYFSGAIFRPGSIRNNRGRTESNVAGVLCAVADFDDEHDPTTRYERLPCLPNAEIETSGGNFQCVYWLSRACSVAEAKPVLKAFTKISGADKCFSGDHIWRMPGTWNWLSDKKRAKGRTKVEPATWSEPPSDDTITIEELRAATPAQVGVAEEKLPAIYVDGEFDWDQRTQDCEPLEADEITNQLKKAGADRSKVVFRLIRRMRDSGYSTDEIATELWTRRRSGNAPVMERYTDEEHWRDDLQRSVLKLLRKDKDGKSLPIIKLEGGKLPAILDACEAALKAAHVGVYRQLDRLVELGEVVVEVRDGAMEKDLLLTKIGPVRLVELLTSVAEFKKPERDGGLATVNCPKDVADGYLARPGTWGVRPLFGIINAPTLRPDGSILDKPGYDESTGLFYNPQGCEFPPIPEKPTREDAFDALAVLDELTGLFPFATNEAHAVALSAMLTGVIRRTLPAAPYFGYDAAVAGSGKSKLADLTSTVASGRKATALNYGPTEEEFDKRYSSTLMRGDQCINVDNITRPVEGEQLCTAATQNPCDFRILGQSQMRKVCTNGLTMFTGNNMEVRGDIFRRLLISTLDPRVERPGERKFSFDPVERALKNRPRYVVACLIILRAYQVAGRPPQDGRVMGSFEEWTRTIRDALLWLGCADPVQLVEVQSEGDSEREQLSQIIELWKTHIGVGDSVTLKQAVEKAGRNMDRALMGMFKEVAPSKDGLTIDNAKLSGYLRKHKNKPIQGYRIVKGKATDREKTGTWRLERVLAAQDAGDEGVAGDV